MKESVATHEPLAEPASTATFGWAEVPVGQVYQWPVWRFGVVLALPEEERVPVSSAQRLGQLFQEDGPAARHYMAVRRSLLGRGVAEKGGELVAPSQLPGLGMPRLAERLERQLSPQVSYHVVPVVRFPAALVELEGFLWLVREGLTICGYPSKSKLWLGATLVRTHHSTLREPLDRQGLARARRTFEPLRRVFTQGLEDFYLDVLTGRFEGAGDPALEIGTTPKTFAEVEIFGVSSRIGLQPWLDHIEQRGLKRALAAHDAAGDPGRQVLKDFLQFAKQPTPTGTWAVGRSRMLDVYYEEPISREPLRALVLTRLQGRKTWYGALSEIRKENRLGEFPSEKTTRALTQEYGRCY